MIHWIKCNGQRINIIILTIIIIINEKKGINFIKGNLDKKYIGNEKIK
jgi:hypothetical protein